MKNILYIIILYCSFLFVRCKEKTGLINEKVKDNLMEFVSCYDFSGYLWIGDDIVDTVKTCLSATLYDIDTNHYITLILSRYPSDAFVGSTYCLQNTHTVLCFSIDDKDLFVYNHTLNDSQLFPPQNSYSEKEIREIEKKYIASDIDDRFVIQTYRYQLSNDDILIVKDSSFDFFQWLMTENNY